MSLSAGIALDREVVAPLMNLIRCNMGFKLVVPSIIEVILTSVSRVVQWLSLVYCVILFPSVGLFFPLKWSFFSLFLHEIVVCFWSVFL